MKKIKILIPESSICRFIPKALYDGIEYRSIDQPSDWPKIQYLHLEQCAGRTISSATKKKLLAFSQFKRKSTKKLKHLSLHLLARYKKTILKNNKLYGIEKPLTSNQILKTSKKNVNFLKNLFPTTNISIENNNDLNTDAYKLVTNPVFFSKLISFSKANMLLDLAHAQISAKTQQMPLKKYLNYLPFEKIRGIHLSRPSLHKKIRDSHFLPQLHTIKAIQKKKIFDDTEFITIEYYKNPVKLTKWLCKISKTK